MLTYNCARARFTSSTVQPPGFSTTIKTSPSPFSNSSRGTGGKVANTQDALGWLHSGPYCAYRHSGKVGRCVSRIDTASGMEAGGVGDGDGEGVGK